MMNIIIENLLYSLILPGKYNCSVCINFEVNVVNLRSNSGKPFALWRLKMFDGNLNYHTGGGG